MFITIKLSHHQPILLVYSATECHTVFCLFFCFSFYFYSTVWQSL